MAGPIAFPWRIDTRFAGEYTRAMVWWNIKKSARLRCPFCDRSLARPGSAVPAADGGDYTKAVCECKAVYGFDPSGSHMGAALMETLVFACDGDWDKALDLDSETDYEVRYLDGYLHGNHRVAPGGGDGRPRPGRGGFVFILLGSGGARPEK